MASRRSPLGPWVKVYVSALDTKAHYSDAQFRALVEAWMHAVRQPVRGQFPNRSALDRKIGSENVDFLISQGDLDVSDDGSITPHRWDEYQSGVLSTGRGASPVDSSRTVPEQFTNTEPRARSRAGVSTLSDLPSTSEPTNGETPPAREAPGFDGEDPVDAFYLTTNQYPNEGGKLRRWIEDVASHGPSRRDFGVIFEGEWRAAGMDVRKALEATDVKLRKMGERAKKAEEQAERDRANRAIFEEPWRQEFRKSLDEQERRGGMQSAGAVLGSLKRSDHSLTDGESPGRESSAVTARASRDLGTDPSSPETGGVQPRTEPGESGPGRDTEKLLTVRSEGETP